MTRPAPPLKVLTPELRSILHSRTDLFLLNVITANWTSQYASQTPTLAPFRDIVASHGSPFYAAILNDFRDYVPITTYDAYKPWVARFHETPCKESRVENLFAPGLPYYVAMSSSTSGKEPKLFPAYQHTSIELPAPRPIFDFSDTRGPVACIFYYGYKEIKQVERESGHVVKRIPFCLASAGRLRMKCNWHVETDESRFPITMPGQVAPWGANMITHNRSFLTIQALFCLVHSDIDQIFVAFATSFVDLLRCADEEWDLLVTCIYDGIIPDLEGIGRLRTHLQAAFSANPDRADELREIGPPSSREGWAALVWPQLRRVAGLCSGSFGTCLPQLRIVLGPTIAIRNHGYGASEAHMSVFYDPDDTETFVFETEEAIEFVGAEAEGIPSDIVQGWELEAGKRYQIVITTRNGLWRYLIDDIIEIVGFDPHNGSPIFSYVGRKTSVIRLPHVVISDAELVAAIKTISSEELILVHDFTTILDKRRTPQTIGFFVELAGELGPKAHATAQRLFDVLGAANNEYQHPLQRGETCIPTIRIVKPGTFMEYRRRKGERMKIGLGQIKVPVVLLGAESHEWILERVTHEL
ncbi:GH3 auxin-responsive promoter [Tylopilus felleus]